MASVNLVEILSSEENYIDANPESVDLIIIKFESVSEVLPDSSCLQGSGSDKDKKIEIIDF